MSVGRFRRYCFTVNNYTEQDISDVNSLECLYLVYGFETGEQGTIHMQGYVVFKNPMAFETLKKKIPRAHIEVALKGHEANIRYCKKDGNYFEKGKLPEMKRSKLNIDELQRIKPKDLIQHLNGTRLLIGMSLENQMLDEIRNDCLEKPYIYYIHGSTGTGKTYLAYKIATQKWENDEIATLDWKNGFAICNNYQAKCLILPEFRPSNVDASTFLQFCDGYGCVLNIKGSHCYIRPRMIIICSIKSPYEIYRDEMNEQFIRRITEIINQDANAWKDI